MEKAGYLKTGGRLGWKPVLLSVSQSIFPYLVYLLEERNHSLHPYNQ